MLIAFRVSFFACPIRLRFVLGDRESEGIALLFVAVVFAIWSSGSRTKRWASNTSVARGLCMIVGFVICAVAVSHAAIRL
jgi:hypothetical protein